MRFQACCCHSKCMPRERAERYIPARQLAPAALVMRGLARRSRSRSPSPTPSTDSMDSREQSEVLQRASASVQRSLHGLNIHGAASVERSAGRGSQRPSAQLWAPASPASPQEGASSPAVAATQALSPCQVEAPRESDELVGSPFLGSPLERRGKPDAVAAAPPTARLDGSLAAGGNGADGGVVIMRTSESDPSYDEPPQLQIAEAGPTAAPTVTVAADKDGRGASGLELVPFDPELAAAAAGSVGASSRSLANQCVSCSSTSVPLPRPVACFQGWLQNRTMGAELEQTAAFVAAAAQQRNGQGRCIPSCWIWRARGAMPHHAGHRRRRRRRCARCAMRCLAGTSL